jgi:hypothetical protein
MSLEAYYEKFNENIKLLKEVKIKDITPVAEVSLTSLEPIPTRPFTKNEMIGAKLVQDFISRTAFESYASVYQAAKHGSISNIPFTTKDITNSIKIYGELIPSLKGKSVAHIRCDCDQQVGTKATNPRY